MVVVRLELVGAKLVCHNCALTGCTVHDEPSDMFRHMLRHAEVGHVVRRGMLDALALAGAILAARKGGG